jgi:hypothetical protein
MARGGNSPFLLLLSSAERAQLAHWQRSTTIQAGLAKRGHIILWRADGLALAEIARRLGGGGGSCAHGSSAFSTSAWPGCLTSLVVVASRCFPPAVAGPLVKMACERPDKLGRSLSPWDGLALARPLAYAGMVEPLSAETVRRILAHQKLKPWRSHLWLSPTTPRDVECCARVAALVDLYTRSLRHDDIVRCTEEQTSLQPRPRRHATRPATSERPHQVEHEYRRAGALHLLAAFDTRTGQVDGQG